MCFLWSLASSGGGVGVSSETSLEEAGRSQIGRGTVKGETGIGTAWSSLGRSSVAGEGARISESKMRVRECTRQKMDAEELEPA